MLYRIAEVKSSSFCLSRVQIRSTQTITWVACSDICRDRISHDPLRNLSVLQSKSQQVLCVEWNLQFRHFSPAASEILAESESAELAFESAYFLAVCLLRSVRLSSCAIWKGGKINASRCLAYSCRFVLK